jgi:transcriptional regulator with XRE-family HTH domain
MTEEPDRDHAPLAASLAGRVNALRMRRGWSLKRLSERSGVSKSMLSQVERSEANPTVAVALAIAGALGVTLDELLEGPAPAPQVIRANDPHFIYRSDSDCRIRTLSPLTADRSLEFYEITLQAEGSLRSAPHFAGTVEHLTVQRGAVRVETGTTSIELGAGDSIAYAADVPHAIVNLRRTRAVVYLIDTVPPGR